MTVDVQQNLLNRTISLGSHFCMFSWVLSSLTRERRSTVVLGDSPSVAEPNR